MKRGGPLRRFSRLRQRSAKKERELRLRRELRKRLEARDGRRCRGAQVWPEVPCFGPLEIDEVVSRARGGSPLDEANTQLLCSAHNVAKEDQPTEARARGLARNSWSPGVG